MLERNLNDRSPRTVHEVGTMHEVARLFSGRARSARAQARTCVSGPGTSERLSTTILTTIGVRTRSFTKVCHRSISR
jgi:hypothetical protein